MNIRKMAKRLMDKQSDVDHSTCGVSGCEHDVAEVAELKPFDPIDHGKTIVPLCNDHLPWAREHNAVAEEIHEEFREYRKEIGEKYSADVNRLSTPPNGELDDAVQVDQVAQATDIVRQMYKENDGETPEITDL